MPYDLEHGAGVRSQTDHGELFVAHYFSRGDIVFLAVSAVVPMPLPALILEGSWHEPRARHRLPGTA